MAHEGNADLLSDHGLTELANEVLDTYETDIPWPEHRPRFLVRVYLREISPDDVQIDRIECVGFQVIAVREGVTVNAGAVRDIPVASIIRKAERQHLLDTIETTEMTRDRFPLIYDDAYAAYREAAAKRLERATGVGTGRRYPEGHLEQVADIVRRARLLREPVQKAVMDAFGLKRSAAANQIARAKARGLLDQKDRI